MPAALPGSTLAQNLGNPTLGRPVIFDAFSGPKGSPFDTDGPDTASTGGLCTGIGFGGNSGNSFLNISPGTVPATAAKSISNASFTDDQGPGLNTPVINSTIIYIGGGRSDADGTPDPYTASFRPGNAGNGGERDAGGGTSCYAGKWVTAAGAVLNGAAVETGWLNRSGVTLAANQSVFGVAETEQGPPA